METVWSRAFFFDRVASLHLVNLDLLKSKQSQMIGKLPKTRYSKLFVLILNSMAFWCFQIRGVEDMNIHDPRNQSQSRNV